MLFQLIDRLACAWLDWRQAQNIAQMQRDMPEMAEKLQLCSFEIAGGKAEIVMSHPAIFVLADEAAAFLKDLAAAMADPETVLR